MSAEPSQINCDWLVRRHGAFTLSSGGLLRYDRKKGEKDASACCRSFGDGHVSAIADDIENAHRQTLAGRDSYWNCPAEEYTRDSNNAMSEPDFTSLIANACPSERQNFRVMLVDYLSQQFPDVDAGAHLTTANNAIALAQKDIVTAFIGRRSAPK